VIKVEGKNRLQLLGMGQKQLFKRERDLTHNEQKEVGSDQSPFDISESIDEDRDELGVHATQFRNSNVFKATPMRVSLMSEHNNATSILRRKLSKQESIGDEKGIPYTPT
jgi:hypothetical protein